MSSFIVLGGAGDVGSRAVEELARLDGVERVTVADRNAAAARRVVERLRGAPAEVAAVAVDAADHDVLVGAMRGHDVAASALGPFFRFEVPLARAALDAGVDYASVCDEWQPAEALFAELDATARERGRIVLTGLGTSPGVTNVAVRLLGEELDRLLEVAISVFQPLNAGGGEAVLRHMLHVTSGEAAALRAGRRTLVPACSEAKVVEFPRFGRVRVWNMGHAEPVTLPRVYPTLREVHFRMGFGLGSRPIVALARLGVFRSRRAADLLVRLAAPLERWSAGAEPAPGAVRVDVVGERDGERVERLLCGVGHMREATGVSLAVGAHMLARRALTTTAPGVHAPEACLPPAAFIATMRERGLVGYADLAMTRLVGGEDAVDATPAG